MVAECGTKVLLLVVRRDARARLKSVGGRSASVADEGNAVPLFARENSDRQGEENGETTSEDGEGKSPQARPARGLYESRVHRAGLVVVVEYAGHLQVPASRRTF